MTDINESIENVAGSLPDIPPPLKKNIFDIMGVQNKETINSKVLAYFLDPNEDHSFGTLFFDSLLKLLIEKKEIAQVSEYTGEFKVDTEDTTYYAEEEIHQQNRIDITIKGGNWSIIIENKLYHFLNNSLEAYYQHAKKESNHVEGIVLSLKRLREDQCTDNGISFTNITHKEWMDHIQKDLILADIDNETDIIYLREYIKTINTHYLFMTNEPINNVLVQAFISQKETLASIDEKKKEATTFIDWQIKSVFSETDEDRRYNKYKQWYSHKKYGDLRFYVIPSKNILENNYIAFGYEIHGKLKEMLGPDRCEEIIKTLKEGFLDEQKKPKEHFHFINDYEMSNGATRLITYRHENFLSEGMPLKKALKNILDTHFFNKGGIQDIVLDMLCMNSGSSTQKVQ